MQTFELLNPLAGPVLSMHKLAAIVFGLIIANFLWAAFSHFVLFEEPMWGRATERSFFQLTVLVAAVIVVVVLR